MESSGSNGSGRSPKRPRKGLRAILLAFTVLLTIVTIIAAFFFVKLWQTRRGAVGIVTTTSGTTAPVSTTTLPPIEGDPDDLDVDYDVDVENPSEDQIYHKVPIDQNVINVVVMSSDARPGEKVGRSDSIMIVSINRKAKSVKLASVMRDTWVPIAGHGWNRINAAYAFGGVGLAVNTLNDNFGLDIQNYVTIRFEEFISIIDQVGGVSVNLSKAEIEYINKGHSANQLDTTAGIKELNGAQALIHARNRKVGNGDFDRTRRQREITLAILQKLKQQRNPITLGKLLTYTLEQVSTNMNANELFTLGLELTNSNAVSFDQAQIPFNKTWHYANENGRSVIAIDIKKNRDMLREFLYGG